MSAPAPASTSPTVVRSQSTSSRPPRAAPSDLPHRTRSAAVRSSTSSQPPAQAHYSHSKTPSYDRRPPSNYAALDSVARRDFEASNAARMPSRREPSSERSQERSSTASRTESTRRHSRNPSSSAHQQESVDMMRTPMREGAADSSQQHATGTHGPTAAAQPRRRTTIATPTGQWALGKTIGAGSMGKVKLAKNMETGEQVINFEHGHWPDKPNPCAKLLMTRAGCRQDCPETLDGGTSQQPGNGESRPFEGNPNSSRGRHCQPGEPSIRLRDARRGPDYLPLVHAV